MPQGRNLSASTWVCSGRRWFQAEAFLTQPQSFGSEMNLVMLLSSLKLTGSLKLAGPMVLRCVPSGSIHEEVGTVAKDDDQNEQSF